MTRSEEEKEVFRKEEDLLRAFAKNYKDGAHGCEMDADTAQALGQAIDSMMNLFDDLLRTVRTVVDSHLESHT